jgi:hypothetical protein
LSLGDFLPQSLKEQLADANLCVGSVLRAFVKDTNPPKIKYYVIIGFTNDKLALGTVYINSDINPNKFTNAELIDLHIPILVSELAFIDHDSFIDCSQIVERNVAAIKDLLIKDPNCHKGNLGESKLKSIFQKLKSARTISKKTKEKFRIFLKG